MLAQRVRSVSPLSFRVLDASKEETQRIPAPAAGMLVRILEEMARGNALTLKSGFPFCGSGMARVRSGASQVLGCSHWAMENR